MAGPLAEGTLDLASGLTIYGPLGIGLLVSFFVIKALFQNLIKTLDLERQRRAELESEIRQLNESVRREVTPMLERAITAITQLLETVRKYESK